MITNIPAPDHLGELELLCHLQCFFKDQQKKYRLSDFEHSFKINFARD